MGIKVAILDLDKVYVQRIGKWMEQKGKKCEFVFFDNLQAVQESVTEEKISLLLAAECMQVRPQESISDIAFAYLTNKKMDLLNGQPTIYKYQKGNDICAEVEKIILEFEERRKLQTAQRRENFKVFAVASVSGGAGAQVIAAALVKNRILKGKKALLINTKLYGSIKNCLAQETVGSVAALFDLVRKDAAMEKIERALKADIYFDYSESPLCRLELTKETVGRFVDITQKSGLFDEVIFVMDLDLHAENLEIYKKAGCIMAVVEGTAYSVGKFQRKMELLKAFSETEDIDFNEKTVIVYNKFDNANTVEVKDKAFKTLGGVCLDKDIEQTKLVDKIANMAIFNMLAG